MAESRDEAATAAAFEPALVFGGAESDSSFFFFFFFAGGGAGFFFAAAFSAFAAFSASAARSRFRASAALRARFISADASAAATAAAIASVLILAFAFARGPRPPSDASPGLFESLGTPRAAVSFSSSSAASFVLLPRPAASSAADTPRGRSTYRSMASATAPSSFVYSETFPPAARTTTVRASLHGDGDAAQLEHLRVVLAVAEREHARGVHLEVLEKPRHRGALRRPRG